MTVLISAANLRVGGGVQVASSFLDELAFLRTDEQALLTFPWLAGALVVRASSAVLADTRPETAAALDVHEHDARLDVAARRLPRVEVSFTLFGPEYVPLRARHRIVGFADGTSLFPERVPEVMRRSAWRQAVRRAVSRHRFSRADTIVTETDVMARALVERWGVSRERVHVVPNTTHGVFERPETWAPSPLTRSDDLPHVLYVTRGYPHKNLAVLGPVGDRLAALGRPVRFVLTLAEHEWEALPAAARAHSVNLGPVKVTELGHLYSSCDASFFPSLLETFSVTPLEALRTGTPLAASDRDFVRNVAGDVPYYADPEDPIALADALAQALDHGRDERVAEGVRAARSWPAARERALAYLGLIDGALRR
ncbi:MAG: glycosyltransferase [Nocardioides sp.]|uniref:glycosyltransferase n=1 Tax=Nocardioides sp. TaxID=35761 RepID=UPI003F0369FC